MADRAGFNFGPGGCQYRTLLPVRVPIYLPRLGLFPLKLLRNIARLITG